MRQGHKITVREPYTERDRDRQKDRDRERETERERDRDRAREREPHSAHVGHHILPA